MANNFIFFAEGETRDFAGKFLNVIILILARRFAVWSVSKLISGVKFILTFARSPRNFLARTAFYSFTFRRMKQKAYAAAGVDIDLGNRVKATLPQLLASTHRREVLGKVGGFGGLFALDVKKYREPVLVSSVDGVGTKLKLAFALDRHDTIGADLVNHCVNDIAVLGAEPLFFLDCF